jgi:ATP-dependent DNA ligase
MFVDPMKAAAITRLPSDAERYILQPKIDGWRVIAGVSDAGTAWLESSTGKRIESVPYITQALAQVFPPNTVLDGEISDEHATKTRSWNRTQTILSRYAVHRPTPQDLPLTFAAFDLLIAEGRDLMADRLADRLLELQRLFIEGGSLAPGLCQVDPDTGGIWAPLRMVEVLPCAQPELDRLLAEGYEGVVVKDVTTRYVQGGRRGEWLKLKPDQEIEGVCTGTYEPTAGSKYDGVAVGGIRFRVEHPDGRVYEGRAAGMDDALRMDLYEHPERYTGRVVEITHKGVTADGALRHPQLRRFRDPADKPVAHVADEAHALPPEAVEAPVPPDETPADPLAAIASALAQGTAAPRRRSTRPPGKRQAVQHHQLVESDAQPGTMRRRVGRNYAAMKDEKLVRVYQELRAGPGHDAYERCVNRGSGDPRADIAEVEALMTSRGLW